MATIKRYSLSCPHCQKELASSWGDTYYGHLPDAFACPNCWKIVTLSPEQRLDKLADQQSSKGYWIIFFASFALTSIVAYLWAGRKPRPLYTNEWAMVIGGILVGSFVLVGLIQIVRKAIIYDRLKAKSKLK